MTQRCDVSFGTSEHNHHESRIRVIDAFVQLRIQRDGPWVFRWNSQGHIFGLLAQLQFRMRNFQTILRNICQFKGHVVVSGEEIEKILSWPYPLAI